MDLTLDGVVLASQADSGSLHLESDDACLRLYVPKDRKQRAISYMANIPERLLSSWCIADTTALKVIADVVKAEIYLLNDLLVELGVPEVQDLQDLADGEYGEDESEDDSGIDDREPSSTSTCRRAHSRSLAPKPPSFRVFEDSTSVTVVAQNRATTPELQSANLTLSRASSSLASTLVTPLDLTSESAGHLKDCSTPYRMLLDKVICAGKRGNIPKERTSLNSRKSVSSTNDLDLDTVFGVRTQDRMAHDMRIGAAGELYVSQPHSLNPPIEPSCS